MNKLLCAVVLCVSSALGSEHEAPTITIEPYQEERDGAAVAKIIQDHSFLQWETTGWPNDTTQKMLKDPGNITEVMRVNNTTIGFVNYLKIKNHYSYGIFRYRWSDLLSIGIDKKYQRQGYGTAFLNYIIATMKQEYAQQLVVAMNPDDSVVRHFFEKSGFKFDKAYSNKIVQYTLYFNVPVDKLPYNIFQRYHKTSLAVFGSAETSGLSFAIFCFYKAWSIFWRPYPTAPVMVSPCH